MRFHEIIEAVTTAYGRKGNTTVRRYRCTTGPRKGRTVASPATCNAPKKIKKSIKLKQTKARLGGSMQVKRSRTLRANPTSNAVQRLNKARKTQR